MVMVTMVHRTGTGTELERGLSGANVQNGRVNANAVQAVSGQLSALHPRWTAAQLAWPGSQRSRYL